MAAHGIWRSDPPPVIDDGVLHPLQIDRVVDMTHMVDVVGVDADRVMKCLAYHRLATLGVADIGVNSIT
jgi:hypothetical protein